LRILYLEHTGLVGGAEHSLLSLLEAFPNGVEPITACPDGPLVDRLAEVGARRVRISGTTASLKLHPWHTAGGVVKLSRAAAETAALARALRADVVHANTLQAGLAAAFAPLGRPLVLHVRDVLPKDLSGWAVRALLRRAPTAVIATSRYVAEQFGSSRGALHVIDNPVNVAKFDPAGYDGAEVRRSLGLPAGAPVLGLIGQITPWKGQVDAIHALSRVRRDFPEVRLLFVGEPKFRFSATRYDNLAYFERLKATISRLGLARNVEFLGERSDVPALLSAMDIVLVPSWQEPFGRTVVEAMAMARPVLATSVGGPSEIITNGVTGRLLPPRQPDAWAFAVSGLLDDLSRAEAMGSRARDHAIRRFSAELPARELIAVYERLLGRGATHSP
jgi:glycosyltransferase involved in cell wall biosynthesis